MHQTAPPEHPRDSRRRLWRLRCTRRSPITERFVAALLNDDDALAVLSAAFRSAVRG